MIVFCVSLPWLIFIFLLTDSYVNLCDSWSILELSLVVLTIGLYFRLNFRNYRFFLCFSGIATVEEVTIDWIPLFGNNSPLTYKHNLATKP